MQYVQCACGFYQQTQDRSDYQNKEKNPKIGRRNNVDGSMYVDFCRRTNAFCR